MRWIIIFFIGCLSCSEIAEEDQAYIRLIRYKYERVPADSLYPFLQHTKKTIVSLALDALGELQDSLTIDTLEVFYKNKDAHLAEKSCFALGQTGFGIASESVRNRIETILLSRNPVSSSLRVMQLVALGKTGGERSLDKIGQAMSDTSVVVAGAACMAAAQMAMRPIRPIPSEALMMPVLYNLSRSDNRQLRRQSTYAMMRLSNRTFTARLMELLQDEDSVVRMYAARGLGNIVKKDPKLRKDTRVINSLLSCASNDSNWMMRVNAVQALSEFKFREDNLKKVYYLIAFEGKPDPSEHVRLTAIRAMAASYAGDVNDPQRFIQPFLERFLPAANWRERAAIQRSLHQMFGESLLDNPRWRSVCEAQLTDSNRYARAQAVAALEPVAGEKVMRYLETALRDSFSLVRLNALTVLGRLRTERSRQLLFESLRTSDYTVLTAALLGLAEDSLIVSDTLKSREICERAAETLRHLPPFEDAGACREMIDAASRFPVASSGVLIRFFSGHRDPMVSRYAARQLGTDVAIHQPKPGWPWKEDDFRQIRQRLYIAVIRTNQGDMEMELYPDAAPVTVMNFITLAEQKFFDGQVFHRVVPNFVVQTGDPLGSGWGGPGYRIISEFSNKPFERGTVGMASAGKDTEGSQWFICHSPQPHLEGRYTVFGKIRKGFETLDRLQVGDRIGSVVIHRF